MAFKRGRKPASDRWGWHSKPTPKTIPEGSGIRGGGKYGITWWGQQWLNAFNNISDSNRLPRGRTYANNGSVRDIHIEGHVVHAKVQGSRLYKVQIEIPKFTDQQKKEIAHIISDNPVLLSQLLNRELPTGLHDLCRENGIELFPRSWNTFHASCSCPDWAMPCKHLAAIIYLVANEIDKNPFLVFSLHDFDLAAALKQSGQTAAAVSYPIPSLESLWIPNQENLPEPLAFDEALLAELDFSLVPELHNTLPAILSANPVFYPSGDFKAVYQKVIASIAKKSRSHIVEPAGAADDRDYRRAEIIEYSLNEHGALLAFGVWDARQNPIFHTSQQHAWEAWLAGVPAGNLAALPADLRTVWLAWRFADALAKQGAIVPQLLQTSGDTYVIRWLPALLDERVAQLHRAFSQLPAPYLMVMERGSTSYVPAEADRALALVSAFLRSRVSDFHGLDGIAIQQPVHALFFKGAPVVFSKFEDKEYPAGIVQWLHHFFITEKGLVPVLEVEEAGADHFEVNLGLENKTLPLEAPVPLAEIFEHKKYAASRVEILRDLSVLAGCFPDLNRLLLAKGRKALGYSTSEFAGVLLQVLPVIRLFGIRVLLPKSLARLLRPRLSLRMDSEGDDGKVLSGGSIRLADMLSYQWQVAIGDYDISPEEFRRLAETGSGLVKIKDEYAYFDEKETRALADKLTRPPQLSGPQLLQTALTGEYEGVRVALSEKLLRLIRTLLSVDLLPLPKGLQATLRPYQHRGYSWLCKNARIGFGSILADDMGLGKTLQVISTLLYLKETGELNARRRALAVVPTTLLTNWQKEVARFAPGLSTAVYHGPNRALEAILEADLVLTTYGVARSDSAKLEKQKWLAIVIDEAQNIKNPATEQSKAIKKLTAPIRIALSGTPVENRLSEYWSVFDFSNKGYLGSLKGFKEQYAIPIEGERDQNALKRFHKATQPFVLRRLKSDKTIISDLPDKIEQNQFCTLTPDQAALYQNVVDLTMMKIENSDGIQRRGLVLQLITTLKQICNHPAQYLKKGPAGPDLSGKCPLLLDLLDQSLENNEKTLIFTQFREMGELLIPIIRERFGMEPDFLHGGVSRKQRDAMVENFQTKSAHPILLLSLKAGGTGLNLTAAEQVIHYDLWWNPAVEAQATDRAYRIGQQRNVQVHRFITAATFEERIDSMIQKKKELANLTVSSGEQWIGELSDRELRNLFRYG